MEKIIILFCIIVIGTYTIPFISIQMCQENLDRLENQKEEIVTNLSFQNNVNTTKDLYLIDQEIVACVQKEEIFINFLRNITFQDSD